MTAARNRGVVNEGFKNMMKTSSKLLVTGAASMLGVALAAGGAYAATGSLTTADAPGQVLQVSGVGPASTHASDTAKAHANANAKGLFVTTPPQTGDKALSHPASMPIAAGHRSVSQVVRPAPKTLPAYHAVMPSSHASMHPAVPVPVQDAPAMMVP
jgi:hypothetical protein